MHEHFDAWCKAVVSRVRFRPDREAIRRELAAHYEDSVRDYLRIGYDEELARSRALTAMGDAAEVGDGLNKAHKPWLGWLWIVTNILLTAAIVTLIADFAWYGFPDVEEWISPTQHMELEEFDVELTCPADFSDGTYSYHFNRAGYDWNGKDGVLILTMNAITPYVWLGSPALSDQLEAVDSRGTLYYADAGVSSVSFHTGCYIVVHLHEKLPEWVEINHKTAGWSFRVDLCEKGGST